MRITNIRIDGFRNLEGISMTPDKEINVLFGENAQGKTNLLEACWLSGGEKSFRPAKDSDFVGFNRDYAQIDMDFEDSVRTQSVGIKLSRNRRERRISLNGVPRKSFSELIGQLLQVVFTPEDLELTKGSPEVRRDYIDLCISQIKPMYIKVLRKYESILAQRNAVIKNICVGKNAMSDLDIWDEQLARQGSYISMLRNIYTNILLSQSEKLYSDISRNKEKLGLKYISTVFDSLNGRTDYKAEMADEYYKKLEQAREDDVRLGYTHIGVHRDDIDVRINDISVKEFGSQGQNRSAALCLKLGQARALYEETKEMPVILLDDVLSELDRYRREFVLSHISGAQIFITCCEPFSKVKGNMYEVSGGKIRLMVN